MNNNNINKDLDKPVVQLASRGASEMAWAQREWQGNITNMALTRTQALATHTKAHTDICLSNIEAIEFQENIT